MKREVCICRLGFFIIVKVLFDGKIYNFGKKNLKVIYSNKGKRKRYDGRVILIFIL